MAAAAVEDFKANFDNPRADLFIDALAAAKSQPEEDAILAALDSLAPYGGPVDVEAAKKSIMATIEEAITNHPRSLQKTIGPSEIGTECDHCLGAKLAEWNQIREGGAWLPTVGTAVHSWLADTFVAANEAWRQDTGETGTRWLVEHRVDVGDDVLGSCDLYDRVTCTLIDWKIVAATTLRTAKGDGPSEQYRVQSHLYGRGWTRRGLDVDTLTRPGRSADWARP